MTAPLPGSNEGLSRGYAPEDRISLVRHVTLLLEQRVLTVGLPLAVAVITLLVSLLLPRHYTATASFMPSGGAGLASNLSGIAAQFGLSVSADDPGQSPAFYADLIQSDGILRTVVTESFPAGNDTVPGTTTTLVAYYGYGNLPREAGIERTTERMRQDLAAVPNLKTGVVQVRFETRSPWLSAGVVGALVDQVNAFNAAQRKTQARAEREFVEGRVTASEEELRVAEDRLQSFLDRNREFRNSPPLLFQHDRLQREVVQRQAVVTTLGQSLEQARIEEVRNTPLISLVEQPVPPAIPDRRRLALKLGAALVVGALVGLGLAYLRAQWRLASSADPAAIGDLRAITRDLRDDLRRLRAGRAS